MSKPLSPAGAREAKAKREFPPYVIEAFNNIIARNLSESGYSRFLLEDVVKEIQQCAFHKHGVELTKDEILDQKLCDVEETYRAEGWVVEYDQPAYCESYSANFTFRVKK